MKLELYVRDVNELSDFLQLDVDTISIGDDGCIKKILNNINIIDVAKKIIDSNKKLKIITPKIPQMYMEETIDLIEKINKITKDYTLVVNDFGILEACREREMSPKRMLIGRALSRALEECAWYEDFVESENEDYVIDLISNNFSDNRKIDLMKEYGVKGIESTLLENSNHAFKWINKRGWIVDTYIGNSTIAYSRNCHYARYKKLSSEECVGKCNEKLNIEMVKGCNGEKTFPVKNSFRENGLKFYLIGNVLYKDNKYDLKDIEKLNYEGVNNLILGTDDYSVEDVGFIIDRLGMIK